eukprot:gb/GEZN01006713.1/.p1 GENE.gb/GEZN01006713.1/~~gb/GEZN01006713.1/.p1  ORF type:complete len:452 (-),score=50.07 gb/GEZN01006713.1/:272-1516(-)
MADLKSCPTDPQACDLVENVAEQLSSTLKTEPNLVFFVGLGEESQVHKIPDFLKRYLNLGEDSVVFGACCSPRIGGGLIGGGKELQHGIGLSVTTVQLPTGATALPWTSISADALPSVKTGPNRVVDPAIWSELFALPEERSPGVLMLADAHTFGGQAEQFVTHLDRILPYSNKIGGLTTAGHYIDGEWLDSGAGGVILCGDVALDSIVAQGALPEGPEFTVTEVEENVLLELDGKPALESLSPYIRSWGQGWPLFVGLGVDPDSMRGGKSVDALWNRGSTKFVVRQVMGVHAETGSIVLAASPKDLRAGVKLQLHNYSSSTAKSELTRQMQLYHRINGSPPAGGLVFSCAGRGSSLYGSEGVEMDLMAKEWGEAARCFGGFFAAGEIGPVGYRTYMHSFTTSIAALRQRGGDS